MALSMNKVNASSFCNRSVVYCCIASGPFVEFSIIMYSVYGGQINIIARDVVQLQADWP